MPEIHPKVSTMNLTSREHTTDRAEPNHCTTMFGPDQLVKTIVAHSACIWQLRMPLRNHSPLWQSQLGKESNEV